MIPLYISRRFISTDSLYIGRIFGFFCFGSNAFGSLQRGYEPSAHSSCNGLRKLYEIETPKLIPSIKSQLENFHIELVDSNLWPISFNGVNARQEILLNNDKGVYDGEIFNKDFMRMNDFQDFDEIEDLRVQRKLFYKLDRGSKEFEECRFRFYRKKTSKKMQRDNQVVKSCKKSERFSTMSSSTENLVAAKNLHSIPRALMVDLKKKKKVRTPTSTENLIRTKSLDAKKKSRTSISTENFMRTKSLYSVPRASVMEAKKNIRTPTSTENLMRTQSLYFFPKASVVEAKKKVRTPTFNQLTDPYHLPFCLDIFITKGSVRASVIHRVTSKVVAVAHSISKDLKFDLPCKKDARACVAVGAVLAQRATEDDIHNVVFTPRKGDKIDGKLQIVLQSVIDHGVDVKLKLKQKNTMKIMHEQDESSRAARNCIARERMTRTT